ncbi:MAG TPA: aminoglycoside phosphotransferase family protein [Solirubrobacteraceae bacterium]|nr:aminoglycoside phosphotransferase family protein [Solirubrobacteraceae bacterium]
MISIPKALSDAVEEDDLPARRAWLAVLPGTIDDLASEWGLELGEPYVPGGQCAWVAPVRDQAGVEAVLKVGWCHWEAEQEADALRLWDGAGAVRCWATGKFEDTAALLLERCRPGIPLGHSLPEPEQDVVLARLMRRLWERSPPQGHPFASLQDMCDRWADAFELEFARDSRGLDPGLAHEGMAMLRELPGSAEPSVLLSTDLHAGNVLAAEREPWLAIDPKPFVGDPAYEAVQHMLNCDDRLAADPHALARRMAELLEVDPERVRLWLFARCVHESLENVTMRAPARRLASRQSPARR